MEFPRGLLCTENLEFRLQISVWDNWQNFNKGPTPVAVAQWVRCGRGSDRVVHTGGSSPAKNSCQFFSAMIFISVLLDLMDFSDIVI